MSRITDPAPYIAPVENPPLDRSLLDVLTEDELDAAEDEGLGGNGEYQDLRDCDVDDLRAALIRESEALQTVLCSPDSAVAEEAYKAARPMDDERSALWHLDLGVAGAVVALVTLGAHPVLSCNGGTFGTPHTFSAPLIWLYLEDADPDRLVGLANRAGIELSVWDGKIVMSAGRIEAFHRLACLVLEAAGTLSSADDREG